MSYSIKNFLIRGFFNIRIDKWLDLPALKSTFNYFMQQTKSLFYLPRKTGPGETFKEALLRFELSDGELESLIKKHQMFVKLFLSFAGILFFYFLYLLFITQNGMGSCMTFALMLYSLSQAFRYHFWLFQLREERLGCTLKEWAASFKKPRTRT